MVALPQKVALPLLPDLGDDERIEAAWGKLQQLIATGETTLVATPTVRGQAEKS
jgi:hypothetical protein